MVIKGGSKGGKRGFACEFCDYNGATGASLAVHRNRYHEELLAERGNAEERKPKKDDRPQEVAAVWFQSFEDRDMLSMIRGIYGAL